jgi:2-polyprenyl-3-methyl-5-hydroxy-6-metoxy-1,4-benzoquinol methylase
MPSKSAKVEAFFSDPDPYLRNNCAIAVRSTLVKDLLGEIRHSRILDLGCGDGSVSVHFLAQRNSVTMLDLSWAMLERARANTPPEYRSRVDYVNADLLDFEAERPYDVVLCIGVLAHV